MDKDNILESTKVMCGLMAEDDSYDLEIITHINSTFFVLQQLGVGPVTGFAVVDGTEKWSEFTGAEQINAVRSYMGLKVKLIFDPPPTGPMTEAMERQAGQLEWRLNIYMEEVKWKETQTTS